MQSILYEQTSFRKLFEKISFGPDSCSGHPNEVSEVRFSKNIFFQIYYLNQDTIIINNLIIIPLLMFY